MPEGAYKLPEAERRTFAAVVAKVWSDGSFAERYRREPSAVLAEHGITHPGDTPAPAVPDRPEGEFALESLDVAAGSTEGPATVGSASIHCNGSIFMCVGSEAA